MKIINLNFFSLAGNHSEKFYSSSQMHLFICIQQNFLCNYHVQNPAIGFRKIVLTRGKECETNKPMS